jgi:protein-L-isoaspartate(D-aspartate) O-methyltransferase
MLRRQRRYKLAQLGAAMIDSARQRTNMVESQIRPSDVTDRRILRAMQDVQRDAFVPQAVRELAYMDEAVPLEAGAARRNSGGRTLMSPRIFAKLVQLLEADSDHRVLIAGAGLGYSAAVLAKIAGSVVALESDEAFAASARGSLTGYPNVQVVTGPLPAGQPGVAPFDCILVEGSIPDSPAMLLSQLKPGGRLAAVLQDGTVGRATVWLRAGDTFGQSDAFEAAASALPGFERAKAFVF